LNSLHVPGHFPTVMADRHTREMTVHELICLPVVNVVPHPVHRFDGPGGISWDVGRNGSIWVKTWTPRVRPGGAR
jgi:hypothetical protein